MWGYRDYVPVAQRQANALAELQKLTKKKGLKIQPVRIAGRVIASTFWGKAWCEHLEKFSDYESRLPRGRTYVRNGSVCHLEIQKGRIVAKVSGSELYTIEVTIKALDAAKWKNLKQRCAGRVGSLLELLQGKLSGEVMTHVTDREHGLFPLPAEIKLECSCPDWADMCKHVAAAMYGIGARLDQQPELLFLLRGVDHAELVGVESAAAVVALTPAKSARTMDAGSIADVFGIDLAVLPPPEMPSPAAPKTRVAKSNKLLRAKKSKAIPAKVGRKKRVSKIKGNAD